MTHAKSNSKLRTPKAQLIYEPKAVLKVIDTLPRDPVLDLIETSGPGRKLVAQDSILRAYYLSQLDETWVPQKPHAVHRLLKVNWRKIADQCRFENVPSWETFRKRFKLLEQEYRNETLIRLSEIRLELRKSDSGKKALPIIAKHRLPRRRDQEAPRSNHQHRKGRIDNALGLFDLIKEAGTDELAESFFIMARWPDGKATCPRPGCGSDHVVDLPGDQLQQWLCLDCEESFDIKTATVFEGTKCGLRTILWAAHLLLQIPCGLPSLVLACVLKEEGRQLSHQVVLDITHRIQTALIEPSPRFAGPVQIDDSLMGYAKGVRTNVIAGVDTSTGRVYAKPIYGPVNQVNSGQFIDDHVEEEGDIYTDSAKNLPEKLRRRQKVNHARRQFARDGEEEGERVSTNRAENLWSTFQEFLDRRRAVAAQYLPLYLAEHMWRYNHASEPTLKQLQAFIRNSHHVVLRGDDKLHSGDRSVEDELAVQLELHPPHPKSPKARDKAKRSSSNKKKGGSQQKMF